MTEASTNFMSSTLMGKQQKKKVAQLLQSLLDSTDSNDFRNPVDWKALNLLDYPHIIKKPMDLGTVKKNLNGNFYETVEKCLKDIDLIWQNCRTYNKDNTFFLKLTEKMEKMTKKMIKNYLPFVQIDSKNAQILDSKDKKAPLSIAIGKKQILKKQVGKVLYPQQPKTYEDRKQNQNEEQKKQQDSSFIKLRKQFLLFVPLCTAEQIGVMFILINKNQPDALSYTQDGCPNVNTQKLSDNMVKRLVDQMDMWGIGYISGKKK